MLLLGTKVDLTDPQCLENIRHDRFQVRLPDGVLRYRRSSPAGHRRPGVRPCGRPLQGWPPSVAAAGGAGVQVQFMPLAEGQEFDNGLFKRYAGLVRDIKMSVSVVGAPPHPPASPSGDPRSCQQAQLPSGGAWAGRQRILHGATRPLHSTWPLHRLRAAAGRPGGKGQRVRAPVVPRPGRTPGSRGAGPERHTIAGGGGLLSPLALLRPGMKL